MAMETFHEVTVSLKRREFEVAVSKGRCEFEVQDRGSLSLAPRPSSVEPLLFSSKPDCLILFHFSLASCFWSSNSSLL